MPKDIKNMIEDKNIPVTIQFESESLELEPILSDKQTCFYLKKRGLVNDKLSLQKFDETEGSFTIPEGYLGILKPIMGEVRVLPPDTYKNVNFNFSMKGHSFNVGTVVAIIYLVKLEKFTLVKTNESKEKEE